MSYSVQSIRNVCLLGHSGSGKTSLIESMLFLTGASSRLGKVADGNTVCDYDPEEVKRQTTISLKVAPVEYNGSKINVMDTPGGFDFVGEVMESLRAADAAIIACPAKGGINVGVEKAWRYCEDHKLPRLIYISKTDEENADYAAALEALRDRFGKNVAPVMAPICDGSGKVIGVIDVLHKKAYEMSGPKGERKEIAVPADQKDMVEDLYNTLKESVAETSEELMEKFFAEEEFTDAEMAQGLRQGVKELGLFPVACGSAISGLGTRMLLDTVVDLLPNPLEGRAHAAEDSDGSAVTLSPAADGAPTAYVFKTISDQYGKYSLVKVLSGSIKPDMPMVNARTGETEKLGRLYTIRGKSTEEIKELGCGDIGAVAKMDKLKTGDTLCDSRRVVAVSPIPFPEPCYSVAIAPKTRGQDDKVAQGLNRMNEEDPSFSVENNAEVHQMIIHAAGDIQVDVLVSKLKSRFNVEAELSTAKVPYREKIRKKVEKQGRHKKQTGGSGQFGDVWIRFEPNLEQEELVFAEEVFGGSVPRNFFPAVEKGLRDAVIHGPLAGYPVVNLKATLYDGSYHPVDSSEIAFKTAAQLSYKAAMPEANPVLLEPVGELKVTIPDSYMGDILGDLNKRRGRIMGMNPVGHGEQEVEAEVPMAEMTSYAIDLRSMTQSRGSFTFHFVRYEDAPQTVQDKVIAESKQNEE